MDYDYDNVPGFIKITKNYGFNFLMTPVGNTDNWDQQYKYGPRDDEFFRKKWWNPEMFLRKNGDMISLGTYLHAKSRSRNTSIIGIDGTNYGRFGTPEIDDNLFISGNPRLPDPQFGQRNAPTL
jgi:hypothetical protein